PLSAASSNNPSAKIIFYSAAFALCFGNKFGDAIELGITQLRTLELQQRGDSLLGRSVKKCLEQMRERPSSRGIFSQRRTIDVSPAVLHMNYSPLLLECAQHRPHCRVARRISNSIHHF